MKFDLDIRTDAALETFFKTFPTRLRNVLLTAALRKAAQPILSQSKSNLASHVRRTGEKTDPIWSGLKIRAGRRRKGAVRVVVMTPTRAELGIPADAKSYYPAHIELGTRDTPALSFMRTALEQTREEAQNILRQELAKGLDALKVGRIRGR